MPAFEAEVGMPYWIDLTTSDPRKSAHFYEQVLGWEISAESQEDNPYQMARLQGLPIAGLIPQPDEAPMPDTWVTYFLSKDIDGDCQRTENLGGRILAAPQPVELGHMALLADAAGGMFGLIQPSGPEHFVAGGEPGTPVWHELTAQRDSSRPWTFMASYSTGKFALWSPRTRISFTPPRKKTAPRLRACGMPKASSHPRCRASGRPT